mgnify:CR=1 FL=1
MILKIRGVPTNEHKRLTKSGDMRICGWIARVQTFVQTNDVIINHWFFQQFIIFIKTVQFLIYCIILTET